MDKKADICLVIEGSYPYVTGGVSTWAHRLIQSFENRYTFSIISLTAGKKTDEDMKYEFPGNVIQHVSFDLFDYSSLREAGALHMPSSRRKEIHHMLVNQIKSFEEGHFDDRELAMLKSIIHDYGPAFFMDILKTEDGYKMITELYDISYSKSGFLKFYYNWRNLFLVTSRAMLLQKFMPDARIYHAFSTGFAGFLTCLHSQLTGVPSVITEHGIYVQERIIELSNSNWLDEFYLIRMWIEYFKKTTAWQYHLVTRLITLYHGNKLLQIEHGADKEKIHVIPNGINIERFSRARKGRLVSKPYKIGLVARIDPIKDIKTFINTIAVIRKVEPDIVAYIVGPCEKEQARYHEECMKLVDWLGLNEVITFTGEAEVLEYYEKFDLLLLTSLKEAMPLSIMEGMACGIPIVATKVGACAELLNGDPEDPDDVGIAGFTATVMDANDIAMECLRLLQNPELANELARTGIRRIERKYREDQVKDAYQIVYEELLGEK